MDVVVAESLCVRYIISQDLIVDETRNDLQDYIYFYKVSYLCGCTFFISYAITRCMYAMYITSLFLIVWLIDPQALIPISQKN